MTDPWFHAIIVAWIALLAFVTPFETFVTLMLALIFYTVVITPWRNE